MGINSVSTSTTLATIYSYNKLCRDLGHYVPGRCGFPTLAPGTPRVYHRDHALLGWLFCGNSKTMQNVLCLFSISSNLDAECVLLVPIQTASLFMTLVRKGLLSSRGYHYWYSLTLALPYAVGLRSIRKMQNIDSPLFLGASWLLFSLRRRGVNKYILWVPFAIGRICVGDLLLHYTTMVNLRNWKLSMGRGGERGASSVYA
jgi:hypothetical protein